MCCHVAPRSLAIALLPCCLALVVSATSPLGGAARAADKVHTSLAEVIDQAATDILADMKGAGAQHLEVSEFTESRDTGSQGGPGLRKRIIDALEKRQPGVIEKGAPLVLKGEFALVDDPRVAEQSAEHIELTLRFTATNKSVIRREYYFCKQRDIAELHNVTLHLSADLPNTAAENKRLRAALVKPDVTIVDKTRILASPDSQYSLQIGAIAPGDSKTTLREVVNDGGRAFVPLQIDELYVILFRNLSEKEVAVAIAIDGIDVFAFSDDLDEQTKQPRYTHFVVGPRGAADNGDTLVVKGWHKTNDPKRSDNFLAFKVTEYGRGAASKFPATSQGNVGAITVSVSHSHLPGDGRAKGNAETGFGPPIKAELKPVERQIDPPHEFISVRYQR